MPAYRLSAPYGRQPLQRRLSGLALALAINIGLLLILLTLGIIPAPNGQRSLRGIVINLGPQRPSASRRTPSKSQAQHATLQQAKPRRRPPPVILPAKRSISNPEAPSTPAPWLEMSSAEMAASDLAKMPVRGSGAAGDSKVVGKGPNGEALYAAEWVREPTDAELSGYISRTASEGFGLVACKTIANDRVEDCVELDQTPGSHLASALRQAAWQFRVRPPRKGGHALVGSWVRIRFDYYRSGSSSGE